MKRLFSPIPTIPTAGIYFQYIYPAWNGMNGKPFIQTGALPYGIPFGKRRTTIGQGESHVVGA